MNMRHLSVRRFLKIVCAGAALSTVMMLLALYVLTGDSKVVICGLVLAAAFFIWGRSF